MFFSQTNQLSSSNWPWALNYFFEIELHLFTLERFGQATRTLRSRSFFVYGCWPWVFRINTHVHESTGYRISFLNLNSNSFLHHRDWKMFPNNSLGIHQQINEILLLMIWPFNTHFLFGHFVFAHLHTSLKFFSL